MSQHWHWVLTLTIENNWHWLLKIIDIAYWKSLTLTLKNHWHWLLKIIDIDSWKSLTLTLKIIDIGSTISTFAMSGQYWDWLVNQHWLQNFDIAHVCLDSLLWSSYLRLNLAGEFLNFKGRFGRTLLGTNMQQISL